MTRVGDAEARVYELDRSVIERNGWDQVKRQTPVWSLFHALESLDQPLALLDGFGTLQHASVRFTHTVQRAGRPLELQVAQLARVVWGCVAAARLGSQPPTVSSEHVRTEQGVFVLHGTYVGADLFGHGPSVLITIEAPAEDPTTVEQLQRRFRLTRAQARVARLLAEGLRNREIAQRLFLSPHTVRHHVEQIRIKTGGHTRAAVAARIRSQEIIQ